ncbi:MAG: ATP-binding protein [Desulfobaccales bacterium]|jgi:PAS domain S-box-containing protein
MPAYFLLLIAIFIQLIAAFLAFRLVRITRSTAAWLFISIGFLLMAVRRCFTVVEWFARGMSLMPVDIGSELVGLATVILMLLGVAFIAPLFRDMMRTQDGLREEVGHRTEALTHSNQALQLELQEREKVEESLRLSEEKFRTIADFTYDWESWLAPDGAYNYISPSCERISGYTAREFLQDPGLIEKIAHPEDRGKVVKHLHDDLSNPNPHFLIFRILTRSGDERWIAHVCQPVSTPEGQILGRRSSNRDITRYQRARAEKVELEAQLRQAQKMEAIGTLAGGIAHDFNNILSPIIMYTEIALRETGQDQELRPYLEQVLKSGKRAAALVKQILTISRRSDQQRIRLRLSPLVKESLKLLRASLPATIDIQTQIAAEWDWVLADPSEIYQVVMNLCTNAAQALEEKGGCLSVGVDQVELAREQTSCGISVPPGNYLRLSVVDTGQGMTPGVLERIFEPYYTTKELGKGTGLGLSMVHGIVKNYGGGIQVVSDPGKGSTFEILFPLMAPDEALEPEPVAAMPEGKERILLVDDEPDIVAAAQIILRQLGYQVTAWTDPNEALAAFRAGPEKFDLILTNLTMPRLTGFDLAREALALRKEIPILGCTGHTEPSSLDKNKGLGIREIIMKPLMPAELAGALRRLLDSPK